MTHPGDPSQHHRRQPFEAMNVGVDVTDDRWSR
jgi:hypothetical protein